MRAKHALTVLLVLALTATAASCSGDDSDGGSEEEGGSAGTVEVVEKDFSIAPSPGSVAAGDVTFSVTNEGPSTHEFVVFQTDLESGDMPLADDGTVDEEGEGITAVDEIEDIAPGDTPTLEVSLDAGSYVLLCNVPGHYAQGMHVGFEVT